MGRIARPLGLIVLGAVLAIAVQRTIGPRRGGERSALLEELAERQDTHLQQLDTMMAARFRANQELVLGQYFRLQQFLRFAERGMDLSLLVVVPAGTEAQDLLSGAPSRRHLELPRVALDPAARSDWMRLGDRLATQTGAVDERVFEAFNDVRAFAADHPWPTEAGLPGLVRSSWSDPLVVDRWLALNRQLAARVDGVLELSF